MESLGVMDLAAVPREFPQFGRLLSNVARTREGVFASESRACDCRCDGSSSVPGCGCVECGGDASGGDHCGGSIPVDAGLPVGDGLGGGGWPNDVGGSDDGHIGYVGPGRGSKYCTECEAKLNLLYTTGEFIRHISGWVLDIPDLERHPERLRYTLTMSDIEGWTTSTWMYFRLEHARATNAFCLKRSGECKPVRQCVFDTVWSVRNASWKTYRINGQQIVPVYLLPPLQNHAEVHVRTLARCGEKSYITVEEEWEWPDGVVRVGESPRFEVEIGSCGVCRLKTGFERGLLI